MSKTLHLLWIPIIGLWVVAYFCWNKEAVPLGQLILGAALLPIVVYGFLYAAWEFRRNCRERKIDLYLDDKKSKMLEIEIREHGFPWRFRPRLLNTAEAVSVWYLVEINIPHILVEQPLPPGAQRYGADQPDAAGWVLEKSTEHPVWVLKFPSEGKWAAYPYYEFDLPTIGLMIDPGNTYEDKYPLHYRIFTEYGKCAEGDLTLQMKREAKGGD